MSRTIHYRLYRADGRMEDLRVYKAWSLFEVQEKFTYSLVFMFVPKGSSTYAFGTSNDSRILHGPAWVLVASGELWAVPHAPVDDHEAYQLWRGTGASRGIA